MQPTYLPWIGYFGLMQSVNVFILLDSVQFSKRSWQQRNQIKTAQGREWLTVPVYSKGKREQLICDVKVEYSSNYFKKHINALELNYKKAPYFELYSEKIFELLASDCDSLSNLTINLIVLLRDLLGIKTKVIRSTEFNTNTSKDELLAELCERVGGTDYISPPGSMVYLDDSEMFASRKISVKYFEFNHPLYAQQFEEFIPYLSVVDLLFNCGEDSLGIIEKGFENQ
jgi:hypothetical protein